MLYARIAKGWRPGGPNALPPVVPPGVPTFFGADSLINYELGAKTVLLDGALSLDADVFLINWSDIQLLVVSGGFGVNSNGGTARSVGFEWDAAWQPVDALMLTFSGAYTDAHLTSGTDPILVGAVSGQPLPYAPRWSTNLDGEYTFAPMGSATPFVGLTWHYNGKRYSGFGGFVVPPTPNQFALGAYNTVDARVGVEWNDWTIELYGKNLGNARGITAFNATGASAASGSAGSAAVIAPRELGIVLTGKI
jgi:outer membrane receptor protein involved in Fe transport